MRNALASPSAPHARPVEAGNPTPLLDPAGPKVILGAMPQDLPTPITSGRSSLFGPRGAFLLASDGQLWIANTGYHRLLGWRRRPTEDTAPADWVIGQTGFGEEGRNGKRPPQAASVNVPTGICGCGEGLAVADAWNYRVLIWRKRSEDNNVPADLVLGHADFNAADANRGRPNAAAETLNWCYGEHAEGEHLYVADTVNRRLLIWDRMPMENSQPADTANSRLLSYDDIANDAAASSLAGQPDFSCKGDNRWRAGTRDSMCWPYAVSVCGETVVIADSCNSRVLFWDLAS